jgi:hypothetical protein
MSPDTFEKLLDEDLQSLLDEATTLFNRKYVENVDGAFPLPRECRVNIGRCLSSYLICFFQVPF